MNAVSLGSGMAKIGKTAARATIFLNHGAQRNSSQPTGAHFQRPRLAMAERQRGLCTFRERDVRAAIRAVEATGKKVERVEIARDGKIVIIPAGDTPEREESEWDAALS